MTEHPQCFKLGPWFLDTSQRELVGRAIALSLMLCLAWAIYPASAWAARWQPVAEASQQRQFVDLDSIKALDQGHVRVNSYYVDSRSGQPQRTDYVTEYDCDRRRFRDVEYNGPVGSSKWMPVAPDPLNSAAMEYVCELGRGEVGE